MSIVRQALIGFAARAYILVLGFAASVIVARSIGPAGQGAYYLMLTVSLLLSTLAEFGMAQSAVVFSSDLKHPAGQINIALLLVAGGGSLVVAAIALPLAAAAGWMMAAPAIVVAGALVLTPVTLYSNLWSALLVGRSRIALMNGIQCAVWTVFLVLLAAAAYAGALDLILVVSLHLAVFGVQFFAQIAAATITFRHERGGESPASLARAMFRFGLPGYASTLCTVLYLRVGVLILAAQHGPAATGVYSIAHQIADKFQIAVRAVQDAIYHRVVSFAPAASVAALNRYLRISAVLFAVLALTGMSAAPLLVPLVFGASYRGAVVPLQLLLAGAALLGMAVLTSTYFVGQLRRPGILSWLAAASALVAIASALVFIPRWSATGAAVSLLITQVVVFLASSALYRRSSGSPVADFLVARKDDYGLLVGLLPRWITGGGHSP